MDKICVIGSNSFSGASFCAHMLKQDVEIIAISRSLEPKSALLPYTWIENHNLQFHRFDLNHDIDKIMQLVDKHKIKHIYNFAAQSMVGQSWQYPEHWFQTNCVATIQLHNELRQRDFVEKYIHVSTPEVYGHIEGAIAENKHYFPSTPYAVSRAASDMSLHAFFEAYGFPVVFTRASNVYGEGQQPYRIIPRTILSILNHTTLPLHGGGESLRSFIHIDDVSSATQLIAEKGALGDIYHISTHQMLSIKQLIIKLCQLMDANFETLCQVTDDRLGKDTAYELDSSKLKTQLGWQDGVNLDDGLRRTIDWVTCYLETLNQLPLEYVHKE